MTSQQIKELMAHGQFPGETTRVELVETHISWVILTPQFAFKIKKPLKFPFLDFSTLDQRAYYCREELRLNRRLAPQMYLDVLPIATNARGQLAMGEIDGLPVEFAVQMTRMDSHRQMDQLLLRNEVNAADMLKLSHLLVCFHRSVLMPSNEVPWKPGDNRADFDDLFRMQDAAIALFGEMAAQQLTRWEEQVHAFLDRHEPRLHERASSGFWVDGHGDLHARNIFLLPEGPVVFDCIEFNAHFRRIDVLSELAFLCMDLDAGGHSELAEVFLGGYLGGWCVIEGLEDESLWLYFKAYRANVRLKVALMTWEQQKNDETEQTARRYWALLGRYLAQLANDACAPGHLQQLKNFSDF